MNYAIKERGIQAVQDTVIVMEMIKFFFGVVLLIKGHRNFLPVLVHSVNHFVPTLLSAPVLLD
jgi:hypothetical protein